MNTVSFFKRFLIIIYDGLLLVGVVVSGAFIISLITPDAIETSLAGILIKRIYVITASFFFYGWFWTHGGQTLGMRAWGVYLVDQQGKFINWKTAFIRYCSALLSWACAGLGFTWILINKRKLAWHDMLSSTYIIKPETKKT